MEIMLQYLDKRFMLHDSKISFSYRFTQTLNARHSQPSGEKWRGRKRYCVLLLAEHDKRKLILQRSTGLASWPAA